MKLLKYLPVIAVLALCSVGLTSCSETPEPDEFDNWQQRNESWLTQIVDSATNNKNGKWLILKKVGLAVDTGTPAITQDNQKNYIFVKVISESTSRNGSPLYTDSVKVDYRGFLMPTDSYPQGLVFDQSYGREFNPATNVPHKFAVNSVVAGWQTALQHMKIGDRWIIYIPQELGYGTEASGNIPAYSTLKFDVCLDSFRHLGDKNWITE